MDTHDSPPTPAQDALEAAAELERLRARVAELESVLSEYTPKNTKTPKNHRADIWIDSYHHCHAQGSRITWDEIARLSGMSRRTLLRRNKALGKSVSLVYPDPSESFRHVVAENARLAGAAQQAEAEAAGLRRIQQALEADIALYRLTLEAIRDYAYNPASESVNAAGMTPEQRLAGAGGQAEHALEVLSALEPEEGQSHG